MTIGLTRASLFCLLIGFCMDDGHAAPIVIDDFSTNIGPTTSNVALDGSMLGGEMDMYSGLLDTATFEINGGIATISGVTDAAAPNNLQISYDGNDNDSGGFSYGLGGVDLTDGGSNDQFVVKLTSVTGDIDVIFRIFESTGNYLTLTVEGITEASDIEFPFADFTAVGTADIASAETVAVFFVLDTGEGVSIDKIEATGPIVPDTLAPSLRVTNAAKLRKPKPSHVIKGTASDNEALSRVEVKAPGKSYKNASLKASGSWTYRAKGLRSGNNRFQARAHDASGNVSSTLRFKVKGK